ncbi:MAG: discoidin domain-containing protein [Phycisphaerae bacterium]|nr:discoidin domain-containing protein [Phycisphaerae bacterium]
MKMRMYISISLACFALLLTGCAGTCRTSQPGEYRNLALNLDNAHYPQATSNSVCGDKPCFAAENAIDGNTSNKGHGPKFPSWGPDRRTDLWLEIDFGKVVEIDKVVIYIRADFPHDSYWKSGTIEFSDGSKEKISLQKTAEPQAFEFSTRRVKWLRITDLVQDEPLGWCGISEVEVWGRGNL